MFTGLIQALGTVQALGNDRLEIRVDRATSAALADSGGLGELALGDSVAVDGVCLTVETLRTGGDFVAALSPETLAKSTLGEAIARRRRVNLEPSLRVGSKLGGHFVTGHVDGTGVIVAIEASRAAWELEVEVGPAVARYLVAKGSIAVNGISLTIAQVAISTASNPRFRVAVIPHTYHHTNLHELRVGDQVNLEADILGKYVEKLLLAGATPGPTSSPPASPLTVDFLATHGY